MAIASKVTIEIESGSVQFLPGAVDYARQGAIPGGLKNNRDFASVSVEGQSEFDELLYDPQTSGGLLISLAEGDAEALEKLFAGAYRVGRVREQGSKAIKIL